ncbi:MAG: aminotransferase class I/II-fold pyridoxal phosphate-dependent enzyme [Symbiobacteriaceae bacterium]|nr:aminotransferase class I/II-fold pyridoxal phosphate-dependent enzyme [Symbiobacteriaceae bacterium]
MSIAKRTVELRSDTLTKPTPAMLQFMVQAELGDDGYREDPTIIALEKKAAALLGFEAGLFVNSGTQGNLVALLSHCQHGDEVILEESAHLLMLEVAGMAAVGGLQARTLKGAEDSRGYMEPDEIANMIRGEKVHWPKTGVISIENTHNVGGGSALSLEQLAAMVAVAHEYRVPLHIDGARIFNAAVGLGVPVKEVVKGASSVQVCLTKGLGAPVGSVVVGSEAFIHRARKVRQTLGGGFRQGGIIAACGLYALDNHVERLAEDHAKAAKLSEALKAHTAFKVVSPKIPTNIVVFETTGTGYDADTWVLKFAELGIKCTARTKNTLRFVTHMNVSEEDVAFAIQVIKGLAT